MADEQLTAAGAEEEEEEEEGSSVGEVSSASWTNYDTLGKLQRAISWRDGGFVSG